MTILSLVPTPFPLEARLDNLPFKYRLRADKRESDSALLLLSLWAATSLFLVHITTHPLALFNGQYNRTIAGIGLLIALALVVFFGRKILAQLALVKRGIIVEVDPTLVKVFTGTTSKNWQCPISEYSGLMEVGLGTKQIGGRDQPLAALILQHEDETRSIPLIIARASQWDRSKIYQYAEALDVPILTEKAMSCSR